MRAMMVSAAASIRPVNQPSRRAPSPDVSGKTNARPLAIGIGGLYGLLTPLGIAVEICLVASIAAILYFYRYIERPTTEQTASIPDGLAGATSALAEMPPGGVTVVTGPVSSMTYTALATGEVLPAPSVAKKRSVVLALTRRGAEYAGALTEGTEPSVV